MAFDNDIYALLVGQDEELASLTAVQLEENSDHLAVDYVTRGDDALDYLETEEVDAVVSRYETGGMDGLTLLDEIKDEYEIPFILYAGEGSEEIAIQALRHGAEDYVKDNNPEDFRLLTKRLENAAFKQKVVNELGVLKNAMDRSENPIQVTDSDGNILYVSEATIDRSGYDEDDLLGEDPSMIISDDNEAQFYSDIWEQVEEGDIWSGEVLKETRSGERYWTNQVMTPVQNKYGETQYMISVNTDITETKTTQERKDMLNSMLRHDIGNDFQVISGHLELLQDTDLNEKQQEYVETMSRALESSEDLITGVRNLLENDGESAETKELELSELADNVLESTEPLAQNRDIQIERNIEEDHTIEAGPLIDQALCNLVENAIVHPEDVTTIEVGAQKQDDRTVVYVADDGEGIPDDFSWEKGVKGKDSDGDGIGTWLVKEVAETYNGEVEVGESELGGARFNMKLHGH